MPKRTHVEIDSDHIEYYFNLISNATAAMNYSSDHFKSLTKDLAAIKKRVLSDLSFEEKNRAATDIKLPEAVRIFGLSYVGGGIEFRRKHQWHIEKDVGEEEFPTTPCIESLIENYFKNFDRTSESTCRTAIDFMLNECLTVMKGLNENTGDGDAQPKTLSPMNDIRIYGEVSFNHKVTPRTTMDPSPNIVIGGHVDYGIGRILKNSFKVAVEQRRRRFYSLLLVIEAKINRTAKHALYELIVYLASLRQSRLQRNRPDASVYGVASDGFEFIFVKILHDGTVMYSRQFDISENEGDLKKVLGCLKHVLEFTESRSPKSRPNRYWDNDEVEDESDPNISVDDPKGNMNPSDDEEDLDW